MYQFIQSMCQCRDLWICNCSGEKAFKNMTYEFGWARNPMIDRVKDIPMNVSMTLIYGSRSWVDYGVGYEVKYRRADSYVGVEVSTVRRTR